MFCVTRVCIGILICPSLLGHASFQGGGIAVTFSAQFPYLTTDRLALIAPTGLLDVCIIYETNKLELIVCAARRHFTHLQVSVFPSYATVDVKLSVPCKCDPSNYTTARFTMTVSHLL